MKNEHLIPVVVLDLITQYKKASFQEKFFIEARLLAIIDACRSVLPKENK